MPEENLDELIQNQIDESIITENDILENKEINTSNIYKKPFNGKNNSKHFYENRYMIKKKKNKTNVENNVEIIVPEGKEKYVHTCTISNTYGYLVYHIMKYISDVIYSEYFKKSDIENVIERLVKNRVPNNIMTISKCDEADTYNEFTGIKVARLKASKKLFERELNLWRDVIKIFGIKNEDAYNTIIDFIIDKINKLNEEYSMYL